MSRLFNTHENTNLLKKFEKVPKLFCNQQLELNFHNITEGILAGFSPTDASYLGLELGSTVYNRASFGPELKFSVYAHKEMSLIALEIPNNTVVRAEMTLLFGVNEFVNWVDDRLIVEKESWHGIRLDRVLELAPYKEYEN